MPTVIDPVRRLALVWRAASDPDGASLMTVDDLEQAQLLREIGLASLEKRKAQPHQLPLAMSSDDDDAQWITYMMLTQKGVWLWERMKNIMRDPIGALGISDA